MGFSAIWDAQKRESGEGVMFLVAVECQEFSAYQTNVSGENT
jgi:hypothetical protein